MKHQIKFNNGTTADGIPVRFSIDGASDNTVFDGFHIEGRRWNGWLQPYVNHETYLQIIEQFIDPIMGTPEEEHMREWFADDGFINGLPSVDDKPDTACGLHAIWWGWCWDQVGEAAEFVTF